MKGERKQEVGKKVERKIFPIHVQAIVFSSIHPASFLFSFLSRIFSLSFFIPHPFFQFFLPCYLSFKIFPSFSSQFFPLEFLAPKIFPSHFCSQKMPFIPTEVSPLPFLHQDFFVFHSHSVDQIVLCTHERMI